MRRIAGSIAAAIITVAALSATATDPLGRRPGYLTSGASSVPNQQAIMRAIWAPGLDDGYVPQGVAIDGPYVYVSGYRSTDPKVDKGPCRVFRVEAATGKEAGAFDLPQDCGHAGGLAWLGGGMLLAGDTHRLYRVEVGKALATGNAADGMKGWVKLGGEIRASFVAFDGKDIWAGRYAKDPEKSRMYRLPASVFSGPGGNTVSDDAVLETIPIPTLAQGAAFDKHGALWVASSSSQDGELYRLDRATGGVQAQYQLVLGVEDLEFDADGRLWTVSEAGSRRWIRWRDHYPVVFQLDMAKLK